MQQQLPPLPPAAEQLPAVAEDKLAAAPTQPGSRPPAPAPQVKRAPLGALNANKLQSSNGARPAPAGAKSEQGKALAPGDKQSILKPAPGAIADNGVVALGKTAAAVVPATAAGGVAVKRKGLYVDRRAKSDMNSLFASTEGAM
jgi:hypothetical protein